ncbi:3-demethylubiquinone-9 3-methyltransferase [Paraphaeosphaeria sporulosa]|uniref:3-demethylubiquinone-9 3-methyltransferase n=1 Tax=Paraphaeosphaeria sporulosa TaxID=1460663 RepID=A0A177CSG3_9PLEO|nr:3-demethylubiquinone-9 3-methyltransferase [Paraphaeosphaeria sporulosa]OAG09717.1 3-demethylubiquinone-9 3-methyltransferase [Paraphaeosphaeria sporulosa]
MILLFLSPRNTPISSTMSFSTIIPNIWFESNAEQAVQFYTTVFPSSSITHTYRYTSAGQAHHNKPVGSVMMLTFSLAGHPFAAINGGPEHFQVPNASPTFTIECEDQAEIDYYWEKLGQGGDEGARACGWLKDRWGVSWQVVPRALEEWGRDGDKEKVRRVMEAMMGMVKLNISELERAFEGAA